MKKFACLMIVSVIVLIFTGCEVTKGSILINEKIPGKEFKIEFSEWTNENKCVLPMKQSDELQIEIISDSGAISLEISDLNGNSTYTGTYRDSTSFTVKVPHDGEYLITMKGSKASGKIDIKNLAR